MRTSRRPGLNDDGETLVELLIAMAIMGIAVIAIVGGIATSILMSDVHRQEASAGAYARNYAEAVATYVNDGHFDATSTPSYTVSQVLSGVSWATFTAPNTLTAPVSSVQCWNDTSKVFGVCAANSSVQKITLTIPTSGSGAGESIAVVVRAP